MSCLRIRRRRRCFGSGRLAASGPDVGLIRADKRHERQRQQRQRTDVATTRVNHHTSRPLAAEQTKNKRCRGYRKKSQKLHSITISQNSTKLHSATTLWRDEALRRTLGRFNVNVAASLHMPLVSTNLITQLVAYKFRYIASNSYRKSSIGYWK